MKSFTQHLRNTTTKFVNGQQVLLTLKIKGLRSSSSDVSAKIHFLFAAHIQKKKYYF
jgi:hypothetical protein